MVRRIAADLKSTLPDRNAKIPLWITGHSLGAALASVLYSGFSFAVSPGMLRSRVYARLILIPSFAAARYLYESEDLGDDIELRDGFVYGCPRIGDAK